MYLIEPSISRTSSFHRKLTNSKTWIRFSMLFFTVSLWIPLCIFCTYSISQSGPAMFQGLKPRVCLVATILDRAGLVSLWKQDKTENFQIAKPWNVFCLSDWDDLRFLFPRWEVFHPQIELSLALFPGSGVSSPLLNPCSLASHNSIFLVDFFLIPKLPETVWA